MFGQWSVLLFVFFFFFEECARVYGNGCVSECLSLQCHSFAQILDRGERCLGRDLQYPRERHQAPRVRVTRSQAGELLKHGRKMLLWRLLERPLLAGNVGVCVAHIYKCFLSVLSRRGGLRRGAVLRSICQASWPSPTNTLDRLSLIHI